MAITICPRCQQRVLHEEFCEDIEHNCNSGSEVLDQEDVVVVGSWDDYTGSGTVLNGVNMQGLVNELQGSRAGLEGEDLDKLTVRGVSANTHRQRQHVEFIDLKKR